jgi:hypothetical protein
MGSFYWAKKEEKFFGKKIGPSVSAGVAETLGPIV